MEKIMGHPGGEAGANAACVPSGTALVPDESLEQVLSEIVPAGHRCGPVAATPDQIARLEAAIERKDVALAALKPTVEAALNALQNAYQRLQQLGWRDAIYCPKDGSTFEAIEAGSTGIHDCHYEGQWPDGSWWVAADGDLWPSRPILYRPKTPPVSDGVGHGTTSGSDAGSSVPGGQLSKATGHD